MKLCLAFLLFIALVANSLAAPYFESNDVAVEPTSGIEKFTFGDLSIDDDEESDQEVFTLEYLEGDDNDEDTDDDDIDDDSVYSHMIAGEGDSKTDLKALTLGDLEGDDNDSVQWYSDVEGNEQDTGPEFQLKRLSGEEIENYGIISHIPKIVKGGAKIIKGIKGGVKAVKGIHAGVKEIRGMKSNNKGKKGNNKNTKGKGKSTKGNNKGSKGKSKGSNGSKKGKKSK